MGSILFLTKSDAEKVILSYLSWLGEGGCSMMKPVLGERGSAATLMLTVITSFPACDFKSKDHRYTLYTIPPQRVITSPVLDFFS